jgi:hypothetical protein
MTRLEELINTAAYPLHHAEGRAALVAAARRSLAEGGFVRLPGFVLPAAVQAMAREAARACAAGGFRRDYLLGAYGGKSAPDLPEDHPLRRRHPYSMHVVPQDILPEEGLVRRLFAQDMMTDLIRDMLGEPELYRCADPLVSCVTTHLAPGDQHGWHFDANDFVVTLLVQKPEQGGEFEFVPGIRSDGAENYEAVAAAMDGRLPGLRLLPAEAGTLIVFQGKRALHRVTPVRGERTRIIALFSYDRRPDMFFPRHVHINAVGRTLDQGTGAQH